MCENAFKNGENVLIFGEKASIFSENCVKIFTQFSQKICNPTNYRKII